MMQRESLKSRLARNVTGTAVITIVALIALVILQYLAVRNLFVATQWTDQRDAVSAVRRAETMTIAFGSATLLILLIGILAIRRSYRARLMVEAEVMRLNQDLEQRVIERTRELTDQAELLDVAHDAILVREMDGTIRFWNKGAESIYGWSKQEAFGKVIHTLLQTEFPLPVRQLYEALQRTGTWEGELSHVRRDGARVYVASRWVLQETANGARVLEINTDITIRKQAQRASQRLEERFRLLVEGVKDYGIFLLDPTGHVSTWNAGAQRIKGYLAEEIIGRHFSCFYSQEEIDAGKPEHELKATAEYGRFEDEGWRIRKDGSRFWANVIVTAQRDPDGRLLGFSKITRDLTERKMAEDRIARLNAEITERNEGLLAANRELETFSYSVSHDLRAPLRSIDGFSAALLEDYADKLDPAAQSYLQRIRAGATRMGHLIDDMITLARTARVEMSLEKVDLSALAQEVAHQLHAMQPERKVEFRIQPALVVQGDRNLLRSVLENLLENAWKFTSKKPAALIELGAERDSHDLVHFVRDNGAGFDMRYADKLFGVFQRLHNEKDYSGTGVGLATVQRIIHRHGGKIWAESRPAQGATFYFELPAARTDNGTGKAELTAQNSSTNRGTNL
jgi:PAS domain S-box-containing protein